MTERVVLELYVALEAIWRYSMRGAVVVIIVVVVEAEVELGGYSKTWYISLVVGRTSVLDRRHRN